MDVYFTGRREYANALDYGAVGGGVVDDTAAIQAALNSSVSEVLIPGGSYKITQTLVVPQNTVLKLTPDTTIFLYADVHAVQLKLNAAIDGNGGTIDVSKAPGFSHAAVFLNAIDFNEMTTSYVDDLNLFGGNNTPTAGDGLFLYASQPMSSNASAWISFFISRNLKATGFTNGIHLQSVANSGASGGAWINGNGFYGYSCYNCITGIRLDGAAYTSANAVGGNQFSDFQIQCSSNMTRGLLISGDQNQFYGQIWDYTSMNIAGGALAVEFTGGSTSEYNLVHVPGLDDTTTAYWKDGQMGSTGRNVVRSGTSSNAMLSPMSFQPAYNGDQDDVLAFADKRWTVTQTSGAAIDVGQLTNAFNLDGESDVSWINVTPANPVVIVIDMTSSPLNWLQVFGIQSKYDEAPANIKMETYDGTTWTTAFNITGNTSNRIVQTSLGQVTVKQIRLTISGSTSLSNSGRMRLGRVFASASTPISPFVTVDGSNPAFATSGNFSTLNVTGTSSFGGDCTVASGHSMTSPTFAGNSLYSNTNVFDFYPQAGGQFSFSNNAANAQLLWIKDSDNSVNVGQYLALGTVASLPAADATKRGMIVTVRGNGAGTADVAYICMMSSTGTYSWKTLISG